MRAFRIVKRERWGAVSYFSPKQLAVSVGIGLVFGFLLRPIPTLAQRILHVDTDATGVGDGSSWEDAFPLLQNALAKAQAGDEIWVAAGTYYPDQGTTVTPGDRETRFNLVNGVGLYGGFAGSETTLEERDFVVNKSILSGDLLQNDNSNIDFEEPTRSDNSFSVVGSIDTDATTLLDGFTITGGHASGDPAGPRFGGGLILINSDMLLMNLIVAENVASGGGGLRIELGNLSLFRVHLTNNLASSGAGISCIVCSAKLDEVAFMNNRANQFGGAARSIIGVITILNSRLHNNESQFGGALHLKQDIAYIANSIFTGNTAQFTGGAIDIGDNPMTTIVNTVFSGNEAGSDGGAINNTLSESVVMINTTFSANTAGQMGGAIWIDDGSGQVWNSIFWGNRAIDEVSNQVGFDTFHPESQLDVAFTLIEGGLQEGLIDGGGMSFEDPLFTDPDGLDDLLGTVDDDLSLDLGSPAIDAGSNIALPPDSLDLDKDGNLFETLPVDLLLHERVFGKGGNDIVVDMGALESDAPPVSLRQEHNAELTGFEEHVSIYPNPAYDYFWISADQLDTKLIALYDVQGRNLAKLVCGAGTSECRVQVSQLGLPSGLYLVEVRSRGWQAMQKVILLGY